MENCVFCRIIKGELSSYKVYEDNDYLAFLSARPLNPGHTLVIPKKHFRWVWDLPIEGSKQPNIGDYYRVISKVARAIRETFGVEYLVSLVFGEEVPHAHVWLVPRFENDGHEDAINLKNIKKLDESEMDQIARRIKETLDGYNR